MGSTSSPATPTPMSDKHYCNDRNNISKNSTSNIQHTVSLSPPRSYYSPPCSTSSPSSTSLNSSIRGSMEEVWKEITLSSFHNHSTTLNSTATASGLAGLHLQDFMPVGARPSATSPTSPSSRARVIGRDMDEERNAAISVFKACPATALSLNSWSDMLGHGVGPGVSVSFGPSLYNNNCRNDSNSRSFEMLGASQGFTDSYKRRVFENGSDCNDKKYKRLMKNRESAARSRARKQAHTNGLEIEVIRLQKENARLRTQVKQLLAAPAQLHPKKHSLRRSLTAPL